MPMLIAHADHQPAATMQHDCRYVPSRVDTAKPAALATSTLKQNMMHGLVKYDYFAVDSRHCVPAKPAVLLAQF